MPHLCLDSLQKEACLARPAGGTVDLSWQLVSPVTVDPGFPNRGCRPRGGGGGGAPTPDVATFCKIGMSKRKNQSPWMGGQTRPELCYVRNNGQIITDLIQTCQNNNLVSEPFVRHVFSVRVNNATRPITSDGFRVKCFGTGLILYKH